MSKMQNKNNRERWQRTKETQATREKDK